VQSAAASVGQPDGAVTFDTTSAAAASASDSGQVDAANQPASNPAADENPGAVLSDSANTGQATSDSEQVPAPASTSPAEAAAPSVAFSYYSVAGPAFSPRTSSVTIGYDSYGCNHYTAGGDYSGAELHIPDGSIIKYIRLYYRATASSVTAFLTKYDGGQSTTDLVNVSSTTTTGWNYIVSSEITETVNNYAYSYMLLVKPNTIGAATQYCGVRVAYYPPVSYLFFLPTIRQ
jgi:hypothetical protein